MNLVRLFKILVLYLSFIGLTSSAYGQCSNIRFDVGNVTDNGDGTYTYKIAVCFDNGATVQYITNGIAVILTPSDVNILDHSPSRLYSGSDYLGSRVGDNIGGAYLNNAFDKYEGSQNIITWEYAYTNAIGTFDPAKNEVCFMNQNDSITITVDQLLEDINMEVTAQFDVYYDESPCVTGPTDGMPSSPCALNDQTVTMCELSTTNDGNFDFQNELNMGQSSIDNLTFVDQFGDNFTIDNPIFASVNIPEGEESLILTVSDASCPGETGTLTIERDGPDLITLVDTINACGGDITLGDYVSLFTNDNSLTMTWAMDDNSGDPDYASATALNQLHIFDPFNDSDALGGVFLNSTPDANGYRLFFLQAYDDALCSVNGLLYIGEGNEFAVNSPIELTECTDNTTHNFTIGSNIESQITNEGASFFWFENSSLTSPISALSYTASDNESVYVNIVPDNGCPDIVATVNFNVSSVNASAVADIESCDGSGVNLDGLESTVDPGGTHNVSWYSDASLSNTITNTSNYASQGTVYVLLENDAATCSDNTSFEITLGDVETNPISRSFCPNIDGEIELDLSLYEDEISNNGFVDHWENVFDQTISNDFITDQATTIVTAIITDAACQGEANFTITMSSGPSVSDHLVEACADGSGSANFDLTAYEPDISTEANLTFTYYTDASMFFPVADESDLTVNIQTDIYVNVITAEGCQSNAVLTVIPSPVISQSTERIICDNDNSGDEAFNLDELKATVTNNNLQYNVTWYKDTNDINSDIFFPGSYFSEGNEEVYANVEHPTLECSAWATVLLSIGNIEARDTAISTCDYNDGQVLIDLTNANPAINNGTNNTVTYYLDEGLSLPVSDASAYVLNNGLDTVYAQVVFGDCETIASVFLSAVSAPVLYNGVIDACNEGGQTGTFDLSATEMDITAGQLYENGRFTSDASGNDDIFFTSSYSSSMATIYYHTDNQGCASIATVDLQVSGLDVINSFLTSCDDGDGNGLYDLSSMTAAVTNGNGYNVTWFKDVDFTVEITDIANYSTNNGYAFGQVEYGSCADTIVLVELFIEDVEANATSLMGCGLNGVGDFDLNIAVDNVKNSPSNNLSFYYDPTRTNVIDENIYSNYSGINGSRVYAIVSDESGCSDTSSVALNVNEIPAVNSAVLFGCDYSQNGTGLFNLTISETQTSSGVGSYTYAYFLDAELQNEIQGDINQFVSTATDVFVEINDGYCENSTTIQLNVANAPAANPVIIDGCDGDLDNLALFDLSGAESQINTNSNLDFTWSNETGSLSGDLSSFQSGSGNLSIQVLEPSTGCSTLTSATLTLNQDIPNIFFKSNCLDNKTQFVYSSAGSFENAIWTFEENQTALGTLVSYEFTSEDIYTVTVSGNSGNCNFEASTEVEVSSFTVQGMEDQTIFEGESVNLFTDLSDDETIIHSWIGDYIDDPNSNNPIAFPQILEGNNIFSYTVEVMNEDSCLASADFFIEVDAERNSGTSTIFTPNNDGENDVFKIEGSGICDIDLNIFNRWGQVVFHGENPGDGWDGTVNGKKQPIDGYAFTAKIIYCNEEEETMNGFITLIR